MRQGMKEKVLDGASGGPNHPRARLINEQKYSFKMAYKLQIVVDNYAEFYDDTALLEQALEWSELSTTYVDLPENRLSRAKVLSKLGYKEEAEMHRCIQCRWLEPFSEGLRCNRRRGNSRNKTSSVLCRCHKVPANRSQWNSSQLRTRVFRRSMVIRCPSNTTRRMSKTGTLISTLARFSHLT